MRKLGNNQCSTGGRILAGSGKPFLTGAGVLFLAAPAPPSLSPKTPISFTLFFFSSHKSSRQRCRWKQESCSHLGMSKCGYSCLLVKWTNCICCDVGSITQGYSVIRQIKIWREVGSLLPVIILLSSVQCWYSPQQEVAGVFRLACHELIIMFWLIQ